MVIIFYMNTGEHNNYNEQKKKEVIVGVIISSGFLIFLYSVIFFIYMTLQSNILFRTDFEQRDELDSMCTLLDMYFSRLETHVIQISKTIFLNEYLKNKTNENEIILKNMFSEFIEHNTRKLVPTLDQVRLIDIKGNELIRVDLGRDGKREIVKKENLQNKSHRYYFKEILESDPNLTYISRLDLNIEYQKIEKPYNPVIRVSRALFDSNGNIIGYLVINQKFQSILSELNSISKHDGDLWYLVNSDGYYLKGPDTSKEYGFMFENKKNIGFFNNFPEIWEQIKNSSMDKFKYNGGYLYVKRYDFSKDTSFDHKFLKRWYLVMDMSNESLNSHKKILNRGVIFGILLISPFLIVIGMVLGRFIVRNRYYIKRLERNATYDDMTGILNHQGAMEKLEYVIGLSSRMGNNLSLAFLDLNDLKKVNDTYGHKIGDKLIILLSEAIKDVVRETDIPARLGGDEFIVLFPGLSAENSNNVMERIMEEFSKKGYEVFGWYTTFSWGVSQWRDKGDTPLKLISRADIEMYKMKKLKKTSIDN